MGNIDSLLKDIRKELERELRIKINDAWYNWLNEHDKAPKSSRYSISRSDMSWRMTMLNELKKEKT